MPPDAPSGNAIAGGNLMKSVRYILLTFLAFAAPGFAAVTVTSPANNATVSSPVQYIATATTTTCAMGVASMGIYVSNKLTYVVNGNSGQRQSVYLDWP
jgi:hypothetical protein